MTAHRRRDLEKRLGNINGAIAKAVDVLLAETPSRALRDRLAALEAERDEIEAEIAEAAGVDRHMVARRLPDLERDGIVSRGDVRVCTASGRPAITWRAR